MQASSLHFSIVIPTYNRVARLQHVIAALERQAYPSEAFEVIVVSDGSTDGTHPYLQSLRSPLRVRWFSQPNRGPAAARNLGVEKATEEFILFLDDDVVPEPQLLAEHAKSHGRAGREVVVLGPLLTPDGFKMTPWVRWEQDMLMKQYEAMLRGDWQATARQFYTGNASLRRRHVAAAGGFDEGFRRAEDVELAYRLAGNGLEFVFNMQAAGMHFAERSFQSWLDAAYLYGRNDVIFTRDRDQDWLLPTIRHEFDARHVFIRTIVRVCRGRPLATRMTIFGLKTVADTAAAIRSSFVERYAYSGLFNLQYYSGLLSELGDLQFLFRPDTGAPAPVSPGRKDVLG